jgi:hypothetical protein
MVFDVLTGVLNALLILFCLLYPLRRKIKPLGKISSLKFHCIFGSLLLLTAIIHINGKLLSLSFSFGFLAFFILILIAVTGFLKRRFMKNAVLSYLHISCVGLFVLAFLIHAAQQIINLLVM